MIFLLRHASTAWNASKRIQGHTDIGITDASRSALDRIRLPEQWRQLKWVCSPLSRAIETARCLGIIDIETHPALIEMDWGAFEGLTLAEIDQQINQRQIQPARGLDFQPPAGESPRAVRLRLKNWLETQAGDTRTMMAVTHKGVIRAALSLATGWDMQQAFDAKVDWRLPLAFNRHPNGRIVLVKINCQWKDTSIFDKPL